MKISSLTIIILLLLSCSGIKHINQAQYENSYFIKRIESKNAWYFIYANRNDSTFMIVSRKPEISSSQWEKIRVGNYYNFNLSSVIPVIDGVRMIPVNYLDFEGIVIDEEGTTVNIDPEKGIYDIYSSDNLKGLFITKYSFFFLISS